MNKAPIYLHDILDPKLPIAMKKENLVLVHSFPTNSILLEGLISYLRDYFNVYFIDLPGFVKTNPLANNRVSLKMYTSYLENKIEELDLPHFIIGGISFGFLVVNSCQLDPAKCKAIMAIEPYINARFLNIGFVQRFIYAHLLNEIIALKISEPIWESPYAEQILAVLAGTTRDRIKTVIREMDNRTFFKTARILMRYSGKTKFQKIPYVLLINKNDTTVKAREIIDIFQEGTSELLVKFNDIDHYPKDVSRSYFKRKLKERDLLQIIDWIGRRFRLTNQ